MTAILERVRVIAPDAGAHPDVFGGAMVAKVDARQAGFLLAEHIVPPGYVVPPHTHGTDDEYFWTTDGALTLMDDPGDTTAGPGTRVMLPRGCQREVFVRMACTKILNAG